MLKVTPDRTESLHRLSDQPARELLFLPTLSGIRRDPGFFVGTGQPAMQSVREFDSDDVIRESLAIRNRSHLRPALARIGRVEERASPASHPDVQVIRCQGTKDGLARDQNGLPASTGIQRALQRAIGA